MVGNKPKAAAQKSAKSVTLPDTVKPEDRMDHTAIINAFKGLLAAENRLQDPLDEIQLIFEKLTRWKMGFTPKGPNGEPPGPEAQEEFVSNTLKPDKGSKLKIHNIKTAT